MPRDAGEDRHRDPATLDDGRRAAPGAALTGLSPDLAAGATAGHGLTLGLAEVSPDGLVVVDEDGRMILANAQMHAMFGYRPGELVGLPIEVLVPDDRRERHAQHRDGFARFPRAGTMGVGLNVSGRRQDGSSVDVEVSLSPMPTVNGQWVIAAVRDVTTNRFAEQARRLEDLTEEDLRIARELTDTVIGGLFGAGLRLQGLIELASPTVALGLQRAVDELDRTIRDIREVLFRLEREP